MVFGRLPGLLTGATLGVLGTLLALCDGDRLSFTQPALVLEQCIGQFLFSQLPQGAPHA